MEHIMYRKIYILSLLAKKLRYPNRSLWSSRDQAIGFLLGHLILIPLANTSFF